MPVYLNGHKYTGAYMNGHRVNGYFNGTKLFNDTNNWHIQIDINGYSGGGFQDLYNIPKNINTASQLLNYGLKLPENTVISQTSVNKRYNNNLWSFNEDENNSEYKYDLNGNKLIKDIIYVDPIATTVKANCHVLNNTTGYPIGSQVATIYMYHVPLSMTDFGQMYDDAYDNGDEDLSQLNQNNISWSIDYNSQPRSVNLHYPITTVDLNVIGDKE